MALTSGTRLGPYEILSPIGKGGMGEVYKAKDTRLDRTVAIKVLPEHLAESPERKARFAREAKAISQLNHPHICTLHDVGEQDGVDYLVMEYIEGETLAERLRKGPLPLNEALEYGVQIADGLDTAHRAGIVHRDLKPGNAILTKSGIKLLDFGLAKILAGEAEPGTSDAPTQQRDLTKENSIIGTLHYMAPEQLDGKAADARTDIFAFGAVLYEMVTGKRAFDGKSQASLIGAIMTSEPPAMSTLQTMIPSAMDHVVKTSLAKDPDERWQSASDVMRELKWIAEEGSTAIDAAAQTTGRAGWSKAAIGAAAGGVVVAVLLWALLPVSTDIDRGITRLRMSIEPAEQLGVEPTQRLGLGEISGPSRTAMAFAPDGKTLVFVGRRDGLQALYARTLDQYEARPLSGTEGAVNPFFSPDGTWIGFWANGQIKKVPAVGGPATTICDVAKPIFGATWTLKDTILYANFEGGLFEAPSAGGTPRAFTTLEEGEAGHRLPSMLPGGRGVLFTVREFLMPGHWETAKVVVVSPETGARKLLVEGGADARYVPTGHLVYADMGTLMGVRFDLDKLEVTGDPAALIDGIAQAANHASVDYDSGAAQFHVSSSGTLAYVPGGIFPETKRKLVWVDRQGRIDALEAPPRSYWAPRISPDGNRIAFHAYTNMFAQVWIYDIGRGALTVLTPDDPSGGAFWTPDGSRVAYGSGGARRQLAWRAADMSVPEETLLEHDTAVWPGRWSPDGRLPFAAGPIDRERDLWALELEGGPKSIPFLRTPADERQPAFSPDGKWLVYVSDVSGRGEVYVQPYPGPGPVVQISTNGGQEPLWSRSGKELFYRSLAPRMVMRVAIEAGSELRAKRPEALFEDHFVTSTTGSFDVAADGRFLMVQPEPMEESEARDELHIVLNWFEELKHLVPTDN